MRPRRGTELHGRGVFITSIVLGVIAVAVSVVRLSTEPLGYVGDAAAVGMIVVGGAGVWRGGYMLEWWGPPES